MARTNGWAALSGLIAVSIAVIAAELTAAVVSPSLSPVTAIGSTVIDVLPPGVKDWAIETFGTADKLAFLVVMFLVMAVAAAGAGVLEYRWRRVGAAVVLTFGLAGIAAVAARPQASTASFAAPVVALVLGVMLISVLTDRLLAWQPRRAADVGVPAPVARRRFLVGVGAGGVVAAASGAAAAGLRNSQSRVTNARERIALPRPTASATPTRAAVVVPAGADLGVDGMAPLVTPNDDYYRIDTALVVPVVDPNTWRLRVTGMVEREVELTFDELLAMPLVESYITLACVSNAVGGDLIGNAKWLGWPVRELLARAGVKDGADMVLSRSIDGFTASTPLAAMTDDRDALIAVGMNDETLPIEHGFPVRLVVPGLYGFVSATKWVTELRVTRYDDDVAYWSTRGWSERGPVKTSSRIDVPQGNSTVPAGTVTIAGYAWAQHRGIEAVDVRVDDGPWLPARLGTDISRDTWRQFSADVDLEPGSHSVQVRAVDSTGAVQVDSPAPVAPDGATGLHTVSFTVS
ncbi:molybdopterin-dependent oxidoreductase [Arthrobacter sp. CAN_A1]|uniref:molybdopterin-dependent oxidoreductase n=1 Tax=Arthrobacter sp. CAN_A1 TaxID=2787717 RepID=UPI0018CB77AC